MSSVPVVFGGLGKVLTPPLATTPSHAKGNLLVIFWWLRTLSICFPVMHYCPVRADFLSGPYHLSAQSLRISTSATPNDLAQCTDFTSLAPEIFTVIWRDLPRKTKSHLLSVSKYWHEQAKAISYLWTDLVFGPKAESNDRKNGLVAASHWLKWSSTKVTKVAEKSAVRNERVGWLKSPLVASEVEGRRRVDALLGTCPALATATEWYDVKSIFSNVPAILPYHSVKGFRVQTDIYEE
ncbi:hypothetical protein GGX14DRAFT_395551 [Mycena pura]|uniref:F-box domain-containing protein n=1 Tax=Mycena pura TaxID=153505 RepID=A0AAD6YCF1_9AGAR|nr:hypothetical protein GGX14DRAFT_395551 [Mycena pura]